MTLDTAYFGIVWDMLGYVWIFCIFCIFCKNRNCPTFFRSVRNFPTFGQDKSGKLIFWDILDIFMKK